MVVFYFFSCFPVTYFLTYFVFTAETQEASACQCKIKFTLFLATNPGEGPRMICKLQTGSLHKYFIGPLRPILLQDYITFFFLLSILYDSIQQKHKRVQENIMIQLVELQCFSFLDHSKEVSAIFKILRQSFIFYMTLMTENFIHFMT